MPTKTPASQIRKEIAAALAKPSAIHQGDAESPEIWSDAQLEAQVSRYLRRWPGRHNSVRLFGAMMSELVERRRAGGASGDDAEIELGLRDELGDRFMEHSRLRAETSVVVVGSCGYGEKISDVD